MNDVDKNELEKVQEEHCKHVFERYERSYKSFQKLFSVLIGFSLIFFFFIYFPYISIQSRNYRIPGQLKNLSDEVERQEKLVNTLEKVQKSINGLQDEINRGPYVLREFIMSLNEPIRESQQLPFIQGLPQYQMQPPNAPGLPPPDPCSSLTGEEWVNCMVKKEVLMRFDVYQRILIQDVFEPLGAYGETVTSLNINLPEIKKQLDEVKDSVEKKLNESPRFWTTFDGKGGMFVEIGEEVSNFWNSYGPIVNEASQRLQQELKTSKTRMGELKKEEKTLEDKKAELIKRLEAIESPFGKLPIGLNEAMLTLPIALAIGFLVCTALFNETMRLRKAFHILYQKKDPGKTILKDSDVTLVAPLWIDPANPGQNKTLKLTILLTPFLFFVMAICLNFYIRTFSDDFSDIGQPNRWVYNGLYVLGFGAFIYGYWQIKREWKRYSSE